MPSERPLASQRSSGSRHSQRHAWFHNDVIDVAGHGQAFHYIGWAVSPQWLNSASRSLTSTSPS
jgi:hypothetical protein